MGTSMASSPPPSSSRTLVDFLRLLVASLRLLISLGVCTHEEEKAVWFSPSPRFSPLRLAFLSLLDFFPFPSTC